MKSLFLSQWTGDRLKRIGRSRWIEVGLCAGCILLLVGCATQRAKCPPGDGCNFENFTPSHLQIDPPELCDETCHDPTALLAGPPPTLRNFEQLAPWDLSLEQVIQMTLSNSKVLNRLGGAVVAAPQGAATVFDPSIQATDPRSSSEAALSSFDANYLTSIFHAYDERRFNNVFFGGGASSLNSYSGNYISELSKSFATGAAIRANTTINYNRNNALFNANPSFWDVTSGFEIRQPLLRNAGSLVNRVAGPNAVPGVYNGVMIARIREDISLVDFEASVRDQVLDAVNAYWDLYYAYQDLDTQKRARDAARETWERNQVRLQVGEDRPDDEAIARQQYYAFQSRVQNSLVGNGTGLPGVYSAERQLRRLMGLPTADGRLIRPITEPTVAEVLFDWNAAQDAALEQRVELRRQKWLVRQRELELCAAKNLALWRVDFVGAYGGAGFGNNLWGSTEAFPAAPPRPGYDGDDGAIGELFGGELDNWRFGFEIQGPLGNRLGHLGVRSAQLNLSREKTVLREQQRQILHDLAASYAEVDRAFQSIRTTYNNRKAVIDELGPKRERVEGGLENVFFLLEAQRRAAAIELEMHTAVVDYNRALVDFAFNEGSLLRLFNVNLAEASSDGVASLCADLDAMPVEPVPAGMAPMEPAPMEQAPTPAAPAEEPVPQPQPVSRRGGRVIAIPALESSN